MADHFEGPDRSGPERSGPERSGSDRSGSNRRSGDRDGHVVSLRDIAEDLRFPVMSRLEAHWQHLRGTRLLPSRSEIDPREIEETLEYAFILERIAPGMARFRLAGMHLNDLMGMEVRGMPLSAFFAPDARKPLSEALERVFDDPSIAKLTLQAETGIGRPAMDARLLLLPLKSDFGDVSRALGCLVTLGPVGRTPRRFSVTASTLAQIAGPEHAGDRRIRGWSKAMRKDTARPPSPRSAPAPKRMSGLAEAPKSYMPAPGRDETTGAAHTPSPHRPPRSDGPPKLYIVHSSD